MSVSEFLVFLTQTFSCYCNCSLTQASASAMDLSEEETTPLVYRDRGGSHRSSCRPGLQVNLHFLPSSKTESSLNIPSGQISAESVCIQAAKICGETCLPCQLQFVGSLDTELYLFFQYWPGLYWFVATAVNTGWTLNINFRFRKQLCSTRSCSSLRLLVFTCSLCLFPWFWFIFSDCKYIMLFLWLMDLASYSLVEWRKRLNTILKWREIYQETIPKHMQETSEVSLTPLWSLTV